MLIAVRVPAGNERGPLYVEQVLDALHARTPFFRRVSLEIGRHANQVLLFCRAHVSLKEMLLRELHAAYPDAILEEVPEEALQPPPGCRRRCFRLKLSPAVAPIRTWREFVDAEQRLLADPVAGLLNMIDNPDVHIRVTLSVRPVARWLIASLHPRAARRPGLQQKLSRKLFAVSLTVHLAAAPRQRPRVRATFRHIAATFSRFTDGSATFRRRLLPRPFYLSTEELAGLWHPPTAQVRTEKLGTVTSRRLEPPLDIPTREREEGIAVLGRVAFRDRRDVCGIRPADRLRHLYVVGKTGMGKTTLLESLARSDIEAGEGILYLDPHGDSAEKLADAIPRERTNDAIYFDPADRSHAVGLNVLACPNPEDRPRLASEIVSILQSIYGIDPSSAPRLLDITRNALLALMEVPGTTLLSLVRMLGDRSFRQSIVRQVSDPVVCHYWEQEFGKWKPSEQAIAVASVQNKIRPFVMDPALRSILGQERNRLDLRKIMDEGKVLIVNLSKGRLGEDSSALIGSLLVSRLQLAAMSRADVAEGKRRPFFAYVDEFQNFATASFATILSEARKYGLALTLANQYISQLEDRNREVGAIIRGAVFGNVGSTVAFQVGAGDANVLAEEFGGGLTPEDLMNLPRYMAYVRLLIDGMPSRPFSIETLKPEEGNSEHRLPIVRRATRHRYARPAQQVKQEIEKMLATR